MGGTNNMKQRFYLIILVITVLVIVGIIAASSSGSKKPSTLPAGVCVCTINSDVGVSTMTVTNENTGKSNIITSAKLPYSFNFTSGDTITVQTTMQHGYTWNCYLKDDGTFDNSNPVHIRSTKTFSLTATFLNLPSPPPE
jgi:hypothetical protein